MGAHRWHISQIHFARENNTELFFNSLYFTGVLCESEKRKTPGKPPQTSLTLKPRALHRMRVLVLCLLRELFSQGRETGLLCEHQRANRQPPPTPLCLNIVEALFWVEWLTECNHGH